MIILIIKLRAFCKSSVYLIYTVLFKPHFHPRGKTLFLSLLFCIWGNWSVESLNNLFIVPQQLRDWPETQTQVSLKLSQKGRMNKELSETSEGLLWKKIWTFFTYGQNKSSNILIFNNGLSVWEVRGEGLICNFWQFLWYKYTHHRRFEGAHLWSLSVELGTTVHSHLLSC